MPDNTVLAIVIPVYNEEDMLTDLIGDWSHVFREAGIAFRFILVDDGSEDGSLALLRQMQEDGAPLSVFTQPNSGHGPAIERGYRMALDAEWVFQIDSDHQFGTTAFRELWDHRDRYDLLLAERKEKNATLSRRCITGVSRLLVRLLCGRGVKDVNSPYRLMRSECLRTALEKIPPESFAPNILLTSWFVAGKKRIFTTITEMRRQDLSRRSKMNVYFLRGSVQSMIQTITFRIRL